MKIAIASGKGGTGKTTLAVSIAATAAVMGRRAAYVDCDVEEPNGHIFFEPAFDRRIEVTVPVPEVDREKCDGCGQCRSICSFNAITVLAGEVMLFSELCHGCGGCKLVCPTGAIREKEYATGTVESGEAVVTFSGIGGVHKVSCVKGELDVGQPKPVPVIKKTLSNAPDSDLCVIDAPPGTSCQMVESVREADYTILVAEPTPFGLNDLRLAAGTLSKLSARAGVVLNRAGSNEGPVRDFCKEAGLEILAVIPDSRTIARIYSRGGIIAAVDEGYRVMMTRIINRLDSIGGVS